MLGLQRLRPARRRSTTDQPHPGCCLGPDSGATAIAAGEAMPARSPAQAASSAGATTATASSGTGRQPTATRRSHVPGLRSGVTAIARRLPPRLRPHDYGGVKCWGYNRYGQLGDGTTIDRRMPVDVSGLAGGVTAITAGGVHSCALTMQAGSSVGASNHFGELGDGTTTRRLTPVSGLRPCQRRGRDRRRR